MAKEACKQLKISKLFKQNAYLCRFSPNGQFLASVSSTQLFIRDVKSLEIIQMFTCVDSIDILEWSSDSKYILCGMKRFVQVWSLEQPKWICKIDEGFLGVTDACWSPDSRHILTTSKFHLRITVWSLISKSVFYIKYAKSGNPGLAFRPDGKYIAVAERRDCQDHISIFECSTWQLLKHFETDTKDLSGISWSPDGLVICTWESVTEDYKILFYSLDGRCLGSYSAYKWALGMKSIAWSPTGQFLAAGSFDEKVRILNNVTWKPIVEYGHPAYITSPEIAVYKEVEKKVPSDWLTESDFTSSEWSKYETVKDRPLAIQVLSSDQTKHFSKCGVSILEFSSNGQYLASLSDTMPTALWIMDLKKHEMTDILLQSQPIKCISWNPQRVQLAVCTGSNALYLWLPVCCMFIKMPFEDEFGSKLGSVFPGSDAWFGCTWAYFISDTFSEVASISRYLVAHG